MLTRIQGLRNGWAPVDYSHRLLVPDSRVCIASDVHIPYHDETLLAEMLENCSASNIGAICWLGDMMGMPTYSPYGRTDHSTAFKRELDILNGVIRLASEVVPFQYWSMGNHEQWWLKKNENQLGIEQLAHMAGLGDLIEDGKLILSDNPALELDEKRWLICHPNNSCGRAFDFASRLVREEQKNVIIGHTHRWGMCSVGDYLAIESGGLFNPGLIDYAQQRGNPGYWFLINSQPIGFRKGN